MLALTSPTSCSRSVGRVLNATEFGFFVCYEGVGGGRCINRRLLDFGSEWSASRYRRYTLVRRLVEPRIGLNDMQKREFLVLPARKQPVYRPRSPDGGLSKAVAVPPHRRRKS
jgi:hypothetical protein